MAARRRSRRSSTERSRTAASYSSPASAITPKGDIKVHTKGVLDQIQQQLESIGSSMEKVLKCNVYLNDLKDYAGMNEMFQGRFGAEPSVRTTIAAAGGIPGHSLVEIDVIATL